ncbi:unnamed protein product [Trichobilharzia regenti]|nr:unnamed protein product [Trichobilharzia regenti]
MLRRRFLCRVIRLYNTCTDVEVSRLPRHNDCLLMWNKVKNQQINLCMSPRVEKVTVSYDGILGKSTLEMTKGISTPLDCAKHLSEMLVKESAIAMVNNVPWDMNRPLICDCSLDFVHFKVRFNFRFAFRTSYR